VATGQLEAALPTRLKASFNIMNFSGSWMKSMAYQIEDNHLHGKIKIIMLHTFRFPISRL